MATLVGAVAYHVPLRFQRAQPVNKLMPLFSQSLKLNQIVQDPFIQNRIYIYSN